MQHTITFNLLELEKKYFKLTDKMKNGITGANMRQKRISQTLSLGGAFHQPRNVNNIEKRWDFTGKKLMQVSQYLSLPPTPATTPIDLNTNTHTHTRRGKENLQFRSGRYANSSKQRTGSWIKGWKFQQTISAGLIFNEKLFESGLN